MISVRQATLDLFRTHGLTTWFGNPGSSELTLLEDFPEDFRYVLGLQEMVPVGMADAYAQITRRPVVVNVHTAPGMGNAQGALYNAFVNKTPLIVTAGNQRRFMQNQYCLLTNIDPTTVPKPFVKWAAEPAIASEAPAVLAHAIHLATTPPMGPVFVSLPMDDMQAELDDTQAADVAVVRDRKVTHAVGFPADLAEEICARINRVLPELRHDTPPVTDPAPDRIKAREAELRAIWAGCELRNDRIRAVTAVTFRPFDETLRDCVESLVSVAKVQMKRKG